MNFQSIFAFLARLVSHLFGPFGVLPLVLAPIMILNTGLSTHQIVWLLPILILTHAVYPIGVFTYFYRKGKITDLDITDRKQREPVYAFGLVGLWVGTLIAMILGSHLLTVLLFLFVTMATVLAIFTFFEKASVHMAYNTAAYFIINILFNWRYWWLFPLLILVAWARWYLRCHNPHQLILGTLISVVVFLTGAHFLL